MANRPNVTATILQVFMTESPPTIRVRAEGLGASAQGQTAVFQAFPRSSPQAPSTTSLVKRLRSDVLPPVARSTGTTLLIGGDPATLRTAAEIVLG